MTIDFSMLTKNRADARKASINNEMDMSDFLKKEVAKQLNVNRGTGA